MSPFTVDSAILPAPKKPILAVARSSSPSFWRLRLFEVVERAACGEPGEMPFSDLDFWPVVDLPVCDFPVELAGLLPADSGGATASGEGSAGDALVEAPVAAVAALALSVGVVLAEVEPSAAPPTALGSAEGGAIACVLAEASAPAAPASAPCCSAPEALGSGCWPPAAWSVASLI